MLLWVVVGLTASTVAMPGLPGLPELPDLPDLGGVGHRADMSRQGDFAAAAREFGVPESVLLGVSYLEARWNANGGAPSVAGGYGPMHLVDAPAVTGDRHIADPPAVAGGTHLVDAPAVAGGRHLADAPAEAGGRNLVEAPGVPGRVRDGAAAREATLRLAERLTGLAPARLRADPAANIRGGAAVLASYQRRPSADPADWYDAVARYSGAPDPNAARAFADEVFAVIRAGATHRTDDGQPVRLTAIPTLRPLTHLRPTHLTPTRLTALGPGATPVAAAPVAGGHPSTSRKTANTAGGSSAASEITDAGYPPPFPLPAPAPTPPPAPTDVAQPRPDVAQPVAGQAKPAAPEDQPPPPGTDTSRPTLPAPHTSTKATTNTANVECPASLACEWMPAAYKRTGKGDYGNHDTLNGPRRIDYIVIHDTEGTYEGVPSMVNDPEYVSWHYTIRSSDGHVAQHVRTKDIAWHAGNWDINSRSIGIEHEGYLASGGTWYTEAMYRSSAKLVKYLATKHHIPLDRAHILGHDNVPGPSPETLPSMHEDPGPYWDWAHYFRLLGSPLKKAKKGTSIIIRPTYETNQPHFTGCTASPSNPTNPIEINPIKPIGNSNPAQPGQSVKPAQPANSANPTEPAKSAKPTKSTKSTGPCPPHGASAVFLRTEPREDAPLVDDIGKRVGKPSTYSVYDHSARASTGQRYAVADRKGDWTAIWYLGGKAWFYNPAAAPTAIPARGPLVTPRRKHIKVYGRAYPEKSAYRGAVAYQPSTPLDYVVHPGQYYSLGLTLPGSYHATNSFNPTKHVTVTGKDRYHQIQFGHRVMFVMARDVRVTHRAPAVRITHRPPPIRITHQTPPARAAQRPHRPA
ncbi:peptidoglycan recognition protein family protein [Nonomuraea aurantiaca]|uniref:peptidoglycan recognition protein family protein n=1 Tax=Nonomuraea aurantiaca TaxID=2878562 RepID=UPI001CD934E7|nr:peptidoglycan recognition family protein [Nonomuraea aurantiaca]MCA2220710.1 N-acetylmuramoyl-L-alanine amidase [Nonomuraea aurantiaca]